MSAAYRKAISSLKNMHAGYAFIFGGEANEESTTETKAADVGRIRAERILRKDFGLETHQTGGIRFTRARHKTGALRLRDGEA